MTNELPMFGFLNLNKPFGWTSHDCVAKVRKLLRLKRVGHAGTLDPAATGVLPMAVGKATRLLQYLPGEKAYKATIRLGIRTTTDDLEGEIIASQPSNFLTLEVVKTALQQFQGKIEQIPPSYSAIQIQGKRLYDLARKGEAVEAPPRVVEIFDVQILDWRKGDFPELDVAISCGAGTYIRAIARDLGILLEIGGTLAGLQRTVSSGFYLENSVNFSNLEFGNFQLLPPDLPLQHLASVTLLATFAQKWCQGQRIFSTTDASGFVRIYDEESNFLGIAQAEENILIPTVVLFQY